MFGARRKYGSAIYRNLDEGMVNLCLEHLSTIGGVDEAQERRPKNINHCSKFQERSPTNLLAFVTAKPMLAGKIPEEPYMRW